MPLSYSTFFRLDKLMLDWAVGLVFIEIIFIQKGAESCATKLFRTTSCPRWRGIRTLYIALEGVVCIANEAALLYDDDDMWMGCFVNCLCYATVEDPDEICRY